MTQEFINSCINTNPLFDAIFSLMVMGKTPDQMLLYEKNKFLLTQLDGFINYNLQKQDGSHHIPLFISYETQPLFRKIFIEYLTSRFGVLNETVVNSITQEFEINRRRGGVIVPPNDGSPLSKEYFKKINFFTDSLRNNKGKMCFGEASRLFKKKVLSLSENCPIDQSSHNIIICRSQELPNGRDSLLKKYYSEQIDGLSTLYCNTQYNGSALFDILGNSNTFDIDNPTHANVYLLYSNTEQADFYQADVALLEQIGLYVDNLFVFVLHSRPFCLKNLKRDLIKFRRYTEDIFFLNEEECSFINLSSTTKLNKLYVGENDDYTNYGLEIRNILEGIQYPYNYRNIISLCATDIFDEVFFDLIKDENPDYDIPESTEIFDYMRLQWEETITPSIKEFVKNDDIAFIVDWKTPEVLKNELVTLFPENNVSFYNLRDLKPTNDCINTIKERKIIMLRYTGFKEDNIVYPNSYEPVKLKEGQDILEIIPLVLFAAKVIRTENNITRFLNSSMQNEYRIDCLGWMRKTLKPIAQFAIGKDDAYYDDDTDDYSSPDRETPRVIIKYETGRESIQNESTPVIYERNGVTSAGRIFDVIDDSTVTGIQLVSEIENHLGVLVTASEHKDSDLEKAQRKNYEQNHGIEVNPNLEIWRLLLIKYIETKGKDVVYNDLINKLEKIEKKPKEIIDRWTDKKIMNLILPRRKKTKNILFDYLGIPLTSPYRGIVYRKKMRAIQSSMERNRLLDQIIYGVVNGQIVNKSFDTIYSQIPEALDLLDISNDEDLEVIREEIIGRINLTKIKYITSYVE